tara:strand:+ start:196 stop:795 length:600 start_codon:yes stop_codon:yes gene_type:complete
MKNIIYYLTLFSLALFVSCSSGDSNENNETLIIGSWKQVSESGDFSASGVTELGEFVEIGPDSYAYEGLAFDAELGGEVLYYFYEDGTYEISLAGFWADGNYEVDGDNLTMDGDTHNITKLNSSSAEVELCCPVVTGPVDLALEDGSIVFDYTSINSNVVQGFERLPKSNSNNKVDENKPTITMNEMRAIMAKKLMESK